MANSDCEKILNLIPLYIDNELCEAEANIVSRHIASCERCKREFDFLTSLKDTAANLEEIDLSADFHKNLMAKANDIKLKKHAKRIKILRRSSAGVAAAAVIALSVAGISNLNNTNVKKPISLVAPTPSEDLTISTDVAESKTDAQKPQTPPAKATVKPDTPSREAAVPKQETGTEESAPATVEASKAVDLEKNASGENVSDNTSGGNTSKDTASSGNVSGGSGGGSSSYSGGGPTAAELPASACVQQAQCTAAVVSLNDENREAVMEILSAYEKDMTGYIVPDINAVLRKIAELGVEVSTQVSEEYAQNYIILN